MFYINSFGNRDYKLFYNEKIKKIVVENFKEDIDLFSYIFDGYKDWNWINKIKVVMKNVDKKWRNKSRI